MAQTTMYPGINNSPQTVLSARISATDTTIPVASVSVFPEAPNLATLGVEDDAEVIRYGGISGLTLINCERGFGGTTAKVWQQNELIYRGYTKYDHDTFKGNIEDLNNNKLDKTGDAKDATVTTAAAVSRVNLATGDSLSVIVGKLMKWFSDFGGAAWLNVGTTASTVAAGLHAAQHKTNGADPLTPANIGAAAAAHKSNHATGGSDAMTPADIGALSTAGNGSNVTVAASAAGTRANLATGDKLSVIVGKLMKWFSDFGAAAWLGVGTTAGTVSAGNHTHSYAGSSIVGGAATSAAKLSTARSISLTGGVTGSASFDGSANASIATTVAPPPRLTALPASGTALADNAEYRVAATVGTYAFAWPASPFEAWLRFTTAATFAITFPAGTTYIGGAPAFEASKTYEMSVKDGVVIVQEVAGE